MKSMLFSDMTIPGITRALHSRSMRSPTWESLATDDGKVTAELLEKICELGAGGIGMIIMSHTFVRLDGKAHPGQIGITTDAHIESHKFAVKAIHGMGLPIAIQITHGGKYAAGPELIAPTGGRLAMDKENDPKPREMTIEDIKQIQQCYVDGARRAKEAGYDLVQLHMGHGYLLSQFHSPDYNKRTDMYGGSIENRMRMSLETIDAIRAVVGPDYPLGVKLNINDGNATGMTLEESTKIVLELNKRGVILFEATGGTYYKSVIRIGKDSTPAYHRHGALAWKKALAEVNSKAVVACVGGIRTGTVAEELLQKGECDLVSIARPLIREPDLLNKWKENPEYQAQCKSCGRCFEPLFKQQGFFCMNQKAEQDKAEKEKAEKEQAEKK